MEKMKEIFTRVCENALKQQDKATGAMPAGKNGPYLDNQTPIRNTCHWAISFIEAYQITKNIKFKTAAKNCLDYVCYNKDYRKKHTFLDRFKPGKDQENGTIGPAWNIEALVEGYRFFKDDNYLNLAKELFYSLPFNKKLGLWHRVTYKGEVFSIDKTYNHQLWFATAAYSLYNETNDEEIKKMVELFFEKDFLKIRKNGLVVHAIHNNFNLKDLIKSIIKFFMRFIRKIVFGKSMKYKEIGYHSFNLYAFSILKKEKCPETFFNSKKLNKALLFCFSKQFLHLLENDNHLKDLTNLKITKDLPFNKYAYAYNAPGFEIPFIYVVWKNEICKEVEADVFWENQLKHTYNKDNSSFSINTEDPITLNARIYELSRCF